MTHAGWQAQPDGRHALTDGLLAAAILLTGLLLVALASIPREEALTEADRPLKPERRGRPTTRRSTRWRESLPHRARTGSARSC